MREALKVPLTRRDLLVKAPHHRRSCLIDAEESGRIFAALQSLPTNQRLAVVLKKFDGLSYDEISQILGCSISAVESLLVRAKKTLHEKLLAHDS